MRPLPEQVDLVIREKKLFREGQAILIAVSGGLDSMVLLRALKTLSFAHRWRLMVAHFNHQLRGQSSDADETLVRQTAKELALPILVGRGDVRQFAKKNSLSLEMAARQMRHRFLARTAKRLNIASVALAHHADDQVELFFMRLLRGSGGEGLAGMKLLGPSPVDKEILLVRPLLSQSKAALRAFARQNKIVFSEDATNLCLDIQRNRIRNQLLPFIEEKFQPALKETVLRTIDLIAAETKTITEMAAAWLAKSRRVSFDRLPLGVQRRCLQLQLFELGQPSEFALIERLRVAPDKAISIAPRRALIRDSSGIIHSRHQTPIRFKRKRQLIVLTGGAGESLFHDLKISWKLVNRPGSSFSPSPNREYFDADKVGNKIYLRHWQPGDRFQPIGAQTARKLQDLFTNLKVPRSERHRRVIAETRQGEIFWVEGLRIGERFKLDKNTTKRLKWQWLDQAQRMMPGSGCGFRPNMVFLRTTFL